MRSTARPMMLVIIWLGIASIHLAGAQQSVTLKDDAVRVINFEDLSYPSVAQQARIQGAVVVQLKLNDEGGVVDAVAISGSPLLVPPTLNNVKKWRFRPNSRKSAIIVYNFVFVEGRCQSHGSLFVLQPSNLATVIGCSPAVNE